MTPWLADSFFYLALLNVKDEAHVRAIESRDSGHSTVTTEFVMIEVADHLCDRKNRKLFPVLYDILRSNRSVESLAASQDLLQAGRELYLQREDKDWSLTDCISFAVMADRGITDALTADHHFEQAGFNAMLK